MEIVIKITKESDNEKFWLNRYVGTNQLFTAIKNEELSSCCQKNYYQITSHQPFDRPTMISEDLFTKVSDNVNSIPCNHFID